MCAVCPDEAWEALIWASIVVERITTLARSPAVGDKIVDFLCHVVMDIGAGVLLDEN